MTAGPIRSADIRDDVQATAAAHRAIDTTTSLYRADRRRSAREWVSEVKENPLTLAEIRALHISLGPVTRTRVPAFGMSPRDVRAAYRWLTLYRRAWRAR